MDASRIDDGSRRGALLDEADLSRFVAGLLIRVAAIAFAVALAAFGHGAGPTDGVEVVETIHQANEAGAGR